MDRRVFVFRAAAAVPGLIGGLAAGAPSEILVPRVETYEDKFFDYYWQLLEGALKRTETEFGPARPVLSGPQMNHERAIRELLAGRIQVYRRGYVPPEFEDRLTVVPVPLEKGLLGYRVFLVHQALLPRLHQVRRLADLKAFSFGLVEGWSDVRIFREAGLQVTTTFAYDGMFSMLQKQRFDIMPISIGKVGGVLQRRHAESPDLVVDDKLLLAYPLAFYFIVTRTPAGERLQQRLTLGLRRMQSDGSFEALYRVCKGQTLQDVRLAGRRLFRIENPYYRDAKYALKDSRLWDSLAAELRG